MHTLHVQNWTCMVHEHEPKEQHPVSSRYLLNGEAQPLQRGASCEVQMQDDTLKLCVHTAGAESLTPVLCGYLLDGEAQPLQLGVSCGVQVQDDSLQALVHAAGSCSQD